VFLVGRWVNGEENAKKRHLKTLFFDAILHVLTNFNACRATLIYDFLKEEEGGRKVYFVGIFFDFE